MTRSIHTASAAADAVTTLVLAPGAAAAAQEPRMAQEMVDLSRLSRDQEVAALAYCDGVYRLTTAAGEAFRVQSALQDGCDMGPPDGAAAVLSSGMMGDRAFVIFAAPEAISAFIARAC